MTDCTDNRCNSLCTSSARLPPYIIFEQAFRLAIFSISAKTILDGKAWMASVLAVAIRVASTRQVQTLLFMFFCSCQLYACVISSVYSSLSLVWAATYVRSAESMVRLYFSTFHLVCGWYVVVKELGVRIILHTLGKNFEVVYFPFSSMRTLAR